MVKPIRLVSGFVTVGFWTLMSRILGFVRDILIAAFMGAGPVAEAFLVAFSLPNMFRRFFAEGAFNTAFVPLFSKKFEAGEDPQCFAQDAFSGLASILIVLTLLAQVFMPWLVLAMAAGFAGDERLPLAVAFGRIAFAYILFISMAALLSGILNATGRFAAAAAAPLLLNIILIAAIVLAEMTGAQGMAIAGAGDPEGLAHGTFLVWGVLVAGVAQLGLVWVAAARAGFRLTLQLPRLTPDMKRLAVLALPAMLAGGGVQINLLLGRQVGCFFDGAIAWLSYADRLYQLPLGVVGIAVGVVLLPDLSRRLRSNDEQGGRDALSRAGEIALALTIPSAVALMVMPVPIVSVLFERGAFGPDDTVATALALAVYGAGLPAFVLQKALQPLYFAREDTRTPFRFALVSMAVNAAIAVGLAPVFGFAAAALGTTLAGWSMVWLLARGSRRLGGAATIDARLRSRAPRLAGCAAAMGVALWVAHALFQPAFQADGLRYLALALLVAFGAAVYFGLAHASGAMRLSDLRGAVRRGT